MRLPTKSITILSTAILLVSCGGKEPLSESISVDPATLEAGHELGSYHISVKSNCSWSVSMTAEVAYWVSMPSGGSGDGSVSVRVLKNPYKSERTGTVEFVTPSGKKATLAVKQAGDSSKEEELSANLRLGTYNLRLQASDEQDINKWATRKSRLYESIKDNSFDIFGVQEVSSTMQSDLKTQYKDTYAFYFFSPYSQNGSGDKAQGIVYKPGLFEISETHFFWACSTPDTMTENDKGSEGNFKRGGCCCVLTHKATGIKLFFMNTHACLNSEPNKTNASVYVDMEKKYNTKGYPSFFVGDMNARPTYDAIATYKSYWKDAYTSTTSRTGVENSYNGFSSTSGKYRIDYVFYKSDGDKVSLKAYSCSNKLYSGQYASDHFPVYVDVTIKK